MPDFALAEVDHDPFDDVAPPAPTSAMNRTRGTTKPRRSVYDERFNWSPDKASTTNPDFYYSDKPDENLGSLHIDDTGATGFVGPSKQFEQFDPARHLAIKDPQTGNVNVFSRSVIPMKDLRAKAEADETDLSTHLGRIKAASLMPDGWEKNLAFAALVPDHLVYQAIEAIKSAGTFIPQALRGEIDVYDPAGNLNLNYVEQVANVAGLIATPGLGRAALGKDPGLGIFGGKMAKTANLEKLATAEDMLQKGANPTQIWNETGWFQGADGKWRFEIPDQNARVVGEPGPALYPSKLADVLSHEDLYKAYPQLKYTSVDTNVDPGQQGVSRGGSIGIEPNMGESKARSTLLHEVTHEISDIEDFAKGGSPQYNPADQAALKELEGEFAHFNDVHEILLIAKENSGLETVHDLAALPDDQFKQVIQKAISTFSEDQSRAPAPGGWLHALYNDPDRLGVIESTVQYQKDFAQQIKVLRDAQNKAFSDYERLAGEVEARNVESRMNLGDQARQDNPPVTTEDPRYPRSAQKIAGIPPVFEQGGKIINGGELQNIISTTLSGKEDPSTQFHIFDHIESNGKLDWSREEPWMGQITAPVRQALDDLRIGIHGRSQTLSPRDQALADFSGDDPYKNAIGINGKIRAGETLTPTENQVVSHVDSAIKEAPPVAEDTIVYRGMPQDKMGETETGFVSTSRNRDQALDFATMTSPDDTGVLYEIKVPKGSRILDMVPHQQDQFMKTQEEALLPRGASFKRIGERQEDNIKVVQLEYNPPGRLTPTHLSQIKDMGPEWQSVPVMNAKGDVIHNIVRPEGIGGPILRLNDDGSLTPGIISYHGTPHSFDKFDIGKIGTGDGSQSYGHGLYFAESPKVAGDYQNNLSKADVFDAHGKKLSLMPDYNQASAVSILEETGNFQGAHNYIDTKFGKNSESSKVLHKIIYDWEKDGWTIGDKKGHLYQVEINAHPDHFLDWDKPLAQQSSAVQALAVEGVPVNKRGLAKIQKGETLYRKLVEATGGPDGASQALRDAGIPGIRYLDQGSRGAMDAKAIEQRISDLRANRETTPNGRTREPGAVSDTDARIKQLEADLEAARNPTRNYVLFDDKHVNITHKNGTKVTAVDHDPFAGGGAKPVRSSAEPPPGHTPVDHDPFATSSDQGTMPPAIGGTTMTQAEINEMLGLLRGDNPDRSIIGLNEALRDGDKETINSPVVAAIDNVIKNTRPTAEDIVVYRGMPSDDMTNFSHGYMSTTLDRNVARDFAEMTPEEGNGVIYEIKVPKGSRILDMNQFDFLDGSNNPQHEQEQLLQRDSFFKRVGKPRKEGDIKIVQLEYVQDPQGMVQEKPKKKEPFVSQKRFEVRGWEPAKNDPGGHNFVSQTGHYLGRLLPPENGKIRVMIYEPSGEITGSLVDNVSQGKSLVESYFSKTTPVVPQPIGRHTK